MTDTEKKSFSSLLKIAVLLIVLIFAGGIIRHEMHTKTPSDTTENTVRKLRLNAQKPVAKTISVNTTYIGYVTPIHSVNILPFINGFVDKVFVSGGQRVQKGDILVVLQQQEYKAQVAAAAAAVDRAKADFNNAETYYKRVEKAGSSAVSAADRDSAKAQYLSALAALSQARADLAQSKVMYDYTVIKAPIDGVVGNVSLTAGDYVSAAAEPLFTIIETNKLRVVFSISDKEYLDFKKDARRLAESSVRLRLANGETYPVAGKLKFTDNALNRDTNSLAVYADFDNPDGYLISNAYVTVLLERNYTDSVRLAQQSVSFLPDGMFVRIANKGKIRDKKVDLLATQDNVFVVSNVFDKEDVVLLNAPDNLPEKATITLTVLNDDK